MSKPGQLLLWLRNTLLDFYYWPRSRREFNTRLAEATCPEAVIPLLWDYQGAGFYRYLRPNQDRTEMARLADRIQQLNPRIIVEIGTRDGGTLLLWAQCASQPELLVSIDLPGGIHGGGYAHARARLYRLFLQNRPGCELELLRADSQSEATRAHLVGILGDRRIVLLFIDGDHRYAGAKRDYELYADLVRPGGIIAFHDIWPNTYDSSIQVSRLWEEIKASGRLVEEIIHEPYTGRYGIGLILV
jgi:predicted O-methyltransferase YrrM